MLGAAQSVGIREPNPTESADETGFAAHPKGLFQKLICRAEKTPNYRDSNTSPFRIFTPYPNNHTSACAAAQNRTFTHNCAVPVPICHHFRSAAIRILGTAHPVLRVFSAR